jgi:hypothetical protein
LSTEVQLKSESLIDEINKLNAIMQSKIQSYEKECIKAFDSWANLRSQLKNDLIEKEEFYANTSSYLNQVTISDVEIKKRIDEANSYLANIKQIRYDLREAMFNKKYLAFVEGSTKLETTAIGELKDTTCSYRLDSIILKDKLKADLFSLCKLSTNDKWRLLYRASRDGNTAEAFHSKCNHQSKTLTIVRSTLGYIFGGYTDQAWDSSGNYKIDNNEFLFSLLNPTSKPIFLKVANNGQDAICCYSTYGPAFGRGHDLKISYDTHSYSNLGYSFKHNDIIYNQSSAQSYLAGSYNFQFDEIEVFTKA